MLKYVGSVAMKEYFKKVIYFAIIYMLTDIFFSNTFLFEKGKIFKVVIDAWTLIFIIGFFLFGLIEIWILKLLSGKINRFIYESNVLICYSAFILRCTDWTFGLFFGFLRDWRSIETIISFVFFIAIVLLVFRNWKYRIEISVSVFLSAFIYAFTHLEIPFYRWLGIFNVTPFLRDIFLLSILILVLLILIILRKKGVYDFRSKKDKWLEKIGDGPYKRIHKVDEEL